MVQSSYVARILAYFGDQTTAWSTLTEALSGGSCSYMHGASTLGMNAALPCGIGVSPLATIATHLTKGVVDVLCSGHPVVAVKDAEQAKCGTLLL